MTHRGLTSRRTQALGATAPNHRPMTPESIYTPEGSFGYLMVILAVLLVVAVGFLLVFTDAAVPF